MRINTREELEARRAEYAASLKTQRKQILICAGTGCVAGGSLNIFAKMQEILISRGIKCSLVLEKEPHDDSVGLKKSGCHGFCEMGPLLRIEPEGILYVKVKVEDCEEIIEKSIVNDEVIERLVYHDQNGDAYEKQDDIPFYKQQTRVALEDCGRINAESIIEKYWNDEGKGRKRGYRRADSPFYHMEHYASFMERMRPNTLQR